MNIVVFVQSSKFCKNPVADMKRRDPRTQGTCEAPVTVHAPTPSPVLP